MKCDALSDAKNRKICWAHNIQETHSELGWERERKKNNRNDCDELKLCELLDKAIKLHKIYEKYGNCLRWKFYIRIWIVFHQLCISKWQSCCWSQFIYSFAAPRTNCSKLLNRFRFVSFGFYPCIHQAIALSTHTHTHTIIHWWQYCIFLMV